MKHSLLFWSRKSHCWAGVYLSAVTLLWLGEMALLPAVYEPRFEVASPSPAVSSVGTPAVSVQDVLDRFSHERVDGEPLTPDTVTFLPKEGSWVVRDAGRYVSVTYDVRTGEARERAFDSAKLVEEKNGLAWLSPELGAALKLSFQPLFILLCVTGIHLLLGRNRRPGKEQEPEPVRRLAVPARGRGWRGCHGVCRKGGGSEHGKTSLLNLNFNI